MTIALLVTVTVIILLSLTVLAFVFRKREKIPCMAGMMIAMTLGMTVGITSGVIFGVIFSGNLISSTLLSMAVGMVIGFIAGVPVSIMAVLDGLLSGLMGGMMGAMLGDMVASGYRDMIIKIMFVLFIGIVFILLYMMQQEITRKKEGTKDSLFLHPLFMLMLLGIFFFGYNQLGSTILISEEKASNISQHEGHRMGQENPTQGFEIMNDAILDRVNKITVMSKEFLYSPKQIRVRQGEKITLVLKNQGKVAHDLEIMNMDVLITDSAAFHPSDHQLDEKNVHIHADPGEQQSLSFVPQQPGLYKMRCTIPGHSTMQGWIKVI